MDLLLLSFPSASIFILTVASSCSDMREIASLMILMALCFCVALLTARSNEIFLFSTSSVYWSS